MYALVLSGGGAKGSYQIGVWRALKELKIDVSLVVGTSVGALNGAFIAQQDYATAVSMWSNIDMLNVFEVEDQILDEISKIKKEGIKSLSLKMVKQPLEKIFRDRGVDISPLRNTIDELLDEDIVRNSSIDFGFVTFSISDKKPLRLFVEDIPYGELKYYLMGSALVPGFTQDKDAKKYFVDGGIYDNSPIKMALKKDYKNIIVVNLRTTRKKKKYLGVNVTHIEPSGKLGNFLYFNKEKSLENMEMGYLDALKSFKKLRGVKYAFNSIPNEQKIISSLHKIPEKDLINISKILMGKEHAGYKVFFEKVIPKLSKTIGLNSSDSYEDFIIGISEYAASEIGIKKLETYEFYDFISKLNKEKIRKDSIYYVIITILNTLYKSN